MLPQIKGRATTAKMPFRRPILSKVSDEKKMKRKNGQVEFHLLVKFHLFVKFISYKLTD